MEIYTFLNFFVSVAPIIFIATSIYKTFFENCIYRMRERERERLHNCIILLLETWEGLIKSFKQTMDYITSIETTKQTDNHTNKRKIKTRPTIINITKHPTPSKPTKKLHP